MGCWLLDFVGGMLDTSHGERRVRWARQGRSHHLKMRRRCLLPAFARARLPQVEMFSKLSMHPLVAWPGPSRVSLDRTILLRVLHDSCHVSARSRVDSIVLFPRCFLPFSHETLPPPFDFLLL